MSRPSRNDRPSAHAKGRPKRRAASTHLFKYQLASDPGRIEENALKKALQESLEEQKSAPIETVVTPNKSMNNDHSKNNRVINSSTNSSDFSGTSNNSSSTCSESRDFLNGIAAKRTRSSVASPIVTPPLKKRAKHTTDGYRQNNISSNTKGDKCDSDPRVLSGSPLPSLNRAIKTYSRSQQVNGHHELRPQRQNSGVSPRSSTPIIRKQATQDQEKTPEETKSKINDIQSVSKSTQTSAPTVNLGNTQINEHNLNDGDVRSSQSPEINTKKISKNLNTSKQAPPVQEQYLKFKRESKNYAYAKMTALKVNTYKSPYINSKSSTKKSSPTGVLNNNTNKITGKSSPKEVSSSGSNQSRLNTSQDDQRQASGKDSPTITPKSVHYDKSSDTSKAASKHIQVTHSAAKSIPQHLGFSAQLFKNDRSSNNTLDLSNIKNQNQASVNVTRKRIAHGSWSLLGVPEEKIIYLRDDEPARRLICYPAIKHIEGDVIQVKDSVLLRSGAKKTDLPYIAKVCAFWEDAETGGVMMGLYWYYRPEHTEEGRRPHHLPDEIFASRHRDVDSVECIEDKCYVLTFNEYCRYKKRVKMEQVSTTWSLADVTIPVSNESYPRRNRIPDTSVNSELVFCCRQIYDSRMKRLMKNPLINSKYGHI